MTTNPLKRSRLADRVFAHLRAAAQRAQRAGVHAGGDVWERSRAFVLATGIATGKRWRAARWAAERVVQGDVLARPAMAGVRDLAVPVRHGTLRARLYEPMAVGSDAGPGIVFFHGGGFHSGDLDSHDGICRRLAGAAGLRLISVSYRLAPSHRFPAPIEDAFDAYDWIVAGGGADSLGLDPARLCVAGDSAGGTLASLIAQHRREGATAPKFQVLMYPLLQMVETNPHHTRVMEGSFVSKRILKHIRRTYLPADSDVFDPMVSPLLAEDLAGVAPAYIVATSLDPLQYEGEVYAERIRMDGGQAEFVRYANAPHGFLGLEHRWGVARQALADAGHAMRAALGAVEPVGG